jgi:hypothetical protein
MEKLNQELTDDYLIQAFLSQELTEAERKEFDSRKNDRKDFADRLEDIHTIALINNVYSDSLAGELEPDLKAIAEASSLSTTELEELLSKPVKPNAPIAEIVNTATQRQITLNKKHPRGFASVSLLKRVMSVAAVVLLLISAFFLFKKTTQANQAGTPKQIAANYLDWRNIDIRRSDNTDTESFFQKYAERDIHGAIEIFEKENVDSLKKGRLLYAGILYLHDNQPELAKKEFDTILLDAQSEKTEAYYFSKWYSALTLVMMSQSSEKTVDTENLSQALIILRELKADNPWTIKRSQIPELILDIEKVLTANESN